MVELREKLKSGTVLVLDGATGTEIARLGGEMNGAAWCAIANKTHPEIVRHVHEEYIRAGADIVTTNTFATCRHVLAGAGFSDETELINRKAVALARQACDNVAPSRSIAIAGSMSNTVAWEEGTGIPNLRYFPTPEQEVANYREMAGLLADAGVDLLILEMMLDIERASRAMEAAVATGLPVWVGISCSKVSGGELVGFDLSKEYPGNLTKEYKAPNAPSLTDIIQALKAIGGEVFGIMHSPIETTSQALDILFNNWTGPVMAYPETMTFDYGTHQSTVTVSPHEFSLACEGWVDRGVQVIGGCCGTTIEHIQKMVELISHKNKLLGK